MSVMDRLIYIADVASEDRGFSEAARIRAKAFHNMKTAFAQAVKTKIAYVKRTGQWLHPDTGKMEAWVAKQ
jgi:HD superfamily phosphohydrolase YqeK